METGAEQVSRAARSTIGSLFRARARLVPNAIAIEDGERSLTYAGLNDRVNRTADLLSKLGIGRGDRIAILSENRIEYLEMLLAAAKLGAVLACQNWRLAPAELRHCINLVEPKLVVVSPRHEQALTQVECPGAKVLRIDADYEALLASCDAREPQASAEPEDALVILYTSGTTGLPKGAVLSHRAELARYLLVPCEYDVTLRDTSVAWSPLFHMVGLEPAVAALVGGGKVIVLPDFDPARLARVVAEERIGWLLLVPGMIEPLIAQLRAQRVTPRGVKQCGAMADLVPPQQVAEITRLLDAPYVNTFGSTETGIPPASSSLIPIGEAPTRLSKTQTGFCEVRLVDEEGRDVPDGVPGELAIRGPTLFSGYWKADETNAKDFRGGWFHMGDVFVRNPDGTLDFVDRVKYLIKSGGENIYPAEIERVLLADDRVADAVVVRRKDAQWGEVPVAVVTRSEAGLSADDLRAACRRELAGFKQPKAFHFVPQDALPRSTTGKIQRHEIEARLERGEIP